MFVPQPMMKNWSPKLEVKDQRSRSICKDHQQWSRSPKRSRSIKWSRSLRSRSMIFLQLWNYLICDRRLSESLSFTSSACPYAWHALPYRRLKHTVGWENSWIYKRSRENRTDSCTHVLSVMVCLMLSWCVSVLPSGGVSSVLPRIDDGKWLTLRKMICLIRER